MCQGIYQFKIFGQNKKKNIVISINFINRFQAALIKYGVHEEDLFQTNDLSEKKDIANVTNTLYALGRIVSRTYFNS